MATIFELKGKMAEAERFFAECDDLPEEAIRDTLEGIEGEIEDKLKDYAAVVKNFESDVAGMKAAETDINARRKALEGKVERMKRVMADVMVTTKLEAVEDPRFKIGFRKCPASVEVVDESKIPTFLFVPTDPRLDKKMLLEMLKDGEDIPGARLVTDKKNFFIK